MLENRGLTRAHVRHMIFKNIQGVEAGMDLEAPRPFVQLLSRHPHACPLAGGVPSAVNGYPGCGAVGDDACRTRLDAILDDLQFPNQNPYAFKQLARSINKPVGSTSSRRSPRTGADTGGQTAVRSPVDALQNMFTLSVFCRYGVEFKRKLFHKDKKIHFHDAFYFHVLDGRAGRDRP